MHFEPTGLEAIFFLKKKKQKDFHPFGRSRRLLSDSNRIDVLWFFLSRKNKSSCLRNLYRHVDKCITLSRSVPR